VGVPAHVGGRLATLTERMRMLLSAVTVGAGERRVMVAVSRTHGAS